MITYPPEMLPIADEPADVVICTGTCDATPPCPMCTIIRATESEEKSCLERPVTELEEAVRLAKDEITRIDAELWKLREEHRENIRRECARHEGRLRDLGERFFYQKEPLEKHREAVMRRLVDVECMKAPQPRIIAETES